MKKLLIPAILMVSLPALGQSWSGLLAPNRAIDWSNVGATIPTVSTTCATQPATGSVADVVTAFNADKGGGSYCVINVPAGSFTANNLSAVFTYAGAANVIIRGAGPKTSTGTVWNFTGTPSSNCIGLGSTAICAWNGDTGTLNGVTNICNWTAGYSKGTTTITYGSCPSGNISNLKVGSIITLNQLDYASDTGNWWPCGSTSCSQQGDNGNSTVNRSQIQQVVVTSINTGANQVTFFPAIYAPNWVSGQTPQFHFSTSQAISNFGIENIQINTSTATPSAQTAQIMFSWAHNVWIKNISSINGVNTSGTGTAFHKHVQVVASQGVTIRDSYMYGASPSSEGYGVDYWQSSDAFTENVIFQHMPTAEILEGSQGGVFAYNFAIDNYYNNGAPAWQQCDQFHHNAGDYYNLWEANIGTCHTEDSIHGTAFANTVFRNALSGFDPSTNTGSVKNQNTLSFNTMFGARYMNYVDNVIGYGGKETTYQYIMASATDCGAGNSGWGYAFDDSGQNVRSAKDCGDGYLIQNDVTAGARPSQSTMRWCNWDAINLTRCIGSESGSTASTYPALTNPTSTIPISLVHPNLTSPPSWWVFPSGTIAPYPNIGSDVSGGNIAGSGGHAWLNPAGNCALNILGINSNGSSGSKEALFDAGVCYPASSPTQVATPTFNPTTLPLAGRVNITTPTTFAAIYYTVDGSTPTSSSALYTHPIYVTKAQTIKAFATKPGFTDSNVATSPSYSPAASKTIMGIMSQSSSQTPSPFPAILRSGGSGTGDTWLDIETSSGNFVWTTFDAWRAKAAANGAKNLYTFSHVPNWCNGSTGPAAPCTDVGSGDATFKGFVTALMQHSCGVVTQPANPLIGSCNLSFIEDWNEFNADGFWSGTDAQKAIMANDASTIVHAYCGDCVYQAGSVSAIDGSHANGQPGQATAAMLDYLTSWAGLPNFSAPDEMSYHAYTGSQTVFPDPFPTTLVSNSSAFCTNINTPNSHCRLPIYTQVGTFQSSSVLSNAAIASWASKLPIAITEGGYGTNDQMCDGGTCNVSDPNVVTLRAGYASQWMISIASQNPDMAMWYAYLDQCWGTMVGTNTSQPNCNTDPLIPSGATGTLSAWNQTAAWLTAHTITGTLTSSSITGGTKWSVQLDSGNAELDFCDAWLTNCTASTSFNTVTTLGGVTSPTGGSVTLTQQPSLLFNQSQVAAPTFSPIAGTYTGAQTVAITTTTPGSLNCVTNDGSIPTAVTAGTCTNGATIANGGTVIVGSSETLKAISTQVGFLNSNVASAPYVINSAVCGDPSQVTFSGSYYFPPTTFPLNVQFFNPTSVCTLHYREATSTDPNATLSAPAPLCSDPVYPVGGFTDILSFGSYQYRLIACQGGFIASAVIGGTYRAFNGQVVAITFTPGAGTYTSAQSIVMATSTPSATIYYTTDGSIPTTSSTQYTAPIPLLANTTLRAFGVATGLQNSTVTTAVYNFTSTLSPPAFSPNGGTFGATQNVTLTASGGAGICYTLDGSTPAGDGTGHCSHGTFYTSPIVISSTTSIRSMATEPGFFDSSVSTATFNINGQLPAPTLTPSGGVYGPAQSVALTDTIPGVLFCYTLNGTTPTGDNNGHCVNGTPYSGPINITVTSTLQVIVTMAGWLDSTVTIGTYTINGSVGIPTFTPGTGSYTPSQTVTLSDTTPGAVICYTMDGSTPTGDGNGHCVHGTTYSGPITVSINLTLKAIGTLSGYIDSTVGTASYSFPKIFASGTMSWKGNIIFR